VGTGTRKKSAVVSINIKEYKSLSKILQTCIMMYITKIKKNELNVNFVLLQRGEGLSIKKLNGIYMDIPQTR
jgi:hypothetical protein